jgi:cyclic pyranopterin phosphate synthase
MTSLVDTFGRTIEYVRLSVTDRCNLRCFYCLPKNFKQFQHRDECLSFEEIERLIRIFSDLGVHRVRLTGGEPLVRKDLPILAGKLHKIPGIEDLSLSTNACLLAQHARSLRAAGVSRINVSLDTLRPDRFMEITGNMLEPVLEGLMAAKAAGMTPIKINVLAMRGINDDEYGNIAEFCMEHDFTLRFIETMPMGSAGQKASEHFLDLRTVRDRLAKRYELVPSVMPGGGPARYYRVRNSGLNIGFITPISQHFCASCNRVRLSADGTLFPCLGQENQTPLRPLLRDGGSDAEIREAILEAIAGKPEKHSFREPKEEVIRFMSMTGG